MTYIFHVVVQQDAHEWHAYCPAFKSHRASTGGQTREEALTHIHSILFIILTQMLAQGAAVPVDVEVPNGTLISVEI
jgi:predicted RNase H-like HicB family nuclease